MLCGAVYAAGDPPVAPLQGRLLGRALTCAPASRFAWDLELALCLAPAPRSRLTTFVARGGTLPRPLGSESRFTTSLSSRHIAHSLIFAALPPHARVSALAPCPRSRPPLVHLLPTRHAQTTVCPPVRRPPVFNSGGCLAFWLPTNQNNARLGCTLL